MKKKTLLLIIGISIFGINQAQVGIKIKNPFGAFHVDSQGNTGGTAASPTNDADDVIITSDGRMGIGTANPTAGVKLDIRGKLRIFDGTQQAGRILTAIDNTGLAAWRTPPMEVVQGKLNENNILIGGSPGTDVTSTALVLDPGKWLILAKATTANDDRLVNPGDAALLSLYTWIILRNVNTNGDVNVVGASPEQSGGRYATPQLSYLADLSVKTTFRIILVNGCNCASTTTMFGGSYFYAIKLN